MGEAVIIDAIRTPMGRRNGSLSGIHPVDLLAHLLNQLIKRTGVNPSLIEDVIIGCVGQVDEQSANIARNAWLAAGLPENVPGTTIDRQCGSSLQALQFAAQGIMAGGYEIAIAGGIESMSRVPMGSTAHNGKTPMADSLFRRYDLKGYGFNQYAGAEMLAEEARITRDHMDEYSLKSHQRAHEARQQGRFHQEIIPISVPDGKGGTKMFAEDETIRPETSIEKMAALKPSFPGLATITAGNSSQIADGASAVLAASRETAEELGLQPRARFVSFSVVGDDPVVMLRGPIPATRKVLERAGLQVEEIDLVEINEAFASVVLRWQKDIGIPLEKVNVNGGAVALGHPLGATGTRMVATLLNELERRKERYGLITLCEGAGMANAMIIERLVAE
ncbi:thiolase family protein [Bacillus badius]|uniref:thiolase family protein n=1 Tax=Bacillus badius TaxID=1455 RepID=UPI001CBE65D6|nr:thiolase family protein [Bacillus badius]UAT32102.1 thiolase family protein [Bacillus badius]